MTKGTKTKKQKLKQLQSHRRSARIGNASVAQGPPSLMSQTSPENSEQLNPGLTFGSIPSMNQLYQTPEGAPPGYKSRRPSGDRMPYLYVPGQGFVAQDAENAPESNKTNDINVRLSTETRTIEIVNSNDDESVREMTESERGRRRAGKSRHHGADTGDDDIEDQEIQQAILNNLPLIDIPEIAPPIPESMNDVNRTFLPPSASGDLNALFHHAASIVTSTIGGENITLTQAHAINTMATQFAANLDAAIAKLMSPRLASETESQYHTRMNAQFRFLQGNVNDNPNMNESHVLMDSSQSRTTVHFSPSTQGGENNTASRPVQILAESLRGTTENAQRVWKDRVAIQRMMNAEMCESGKSVFPDQGISFDESGNPYDRNHK
ncbi:hypothetical protein C8J56DRAFT_890662 [Mycena floridula]|nr:hypothetical protein C8J56DRAFT_890662 [Mycena floridula]